MEKKWIFIKKIEVQFADLDSNSHVNNCVFFSNF